MIPHHPGLLGSRYLPRRGQRRQTAACVRFYINHRSCTEPVLVLQQSCNLWQQAGVKRGIEEHNLKRLRRTGEKAQGIHMLHLSADRAPFGEPRAQLSNSDTISLNKCHLCRSA